ncbi:MAG: DUF2141 domain-containing protein [Prevotellaceae bacterium]|jgi:uncharacterized protein (DUF2141 family)|nr:DUF2141 domain-containing protein [Prevotellaceae bacterium]
MKPIKLIAYICFFALDTGLLSAQTLTVKVENIEHIKSNLIVKLFNNAKDFPDVHFKSQDVKITDKTMTVTFPNLPKGMYAVTVYQDINENKQLDNNFLGIPKEKYGLSNNIYKPSKPDFKTCSFLINSDITINIKLK